MSLRYNLPRSRYWSSKRPVWHVDGVRLGFPVTASCFWLSCLISKQSPVLVPWPSSATTSSKGFLKTLPVITQRKTLLGKRSRRSGLFPTSTWYREWEKGPQSYELWSTTLHVIEVNDTLLVPSYVATMRYPNLLMLPTTGWSSSSCHVGPLYFSRRCTNHLNPI